MGQIYRNPKRLTPNQLKYADKYMDKSGEDWEEYSTIPVEHEVFEWDDGFVDYTVYQFEEFDEDQAMLMSPNTMFIHCMYAESVGSYMKKFKEILEVAKYKYKCNLVQFKTSREPEAWKKLIKKSTGLQAKVNTVVLDIKLDKEDKNEDL